MFATEASGLLEEVFRKQSRFRWSIARRQIFESAVQLQTSYAKSASARFLAHLMKMSGLYWNPGSLDRKRRAPANSIIEAAALDGHGRPRREGLVSKVDELQVCCMSMLAPMAGAVRFVGVLLESLACLQACTLSQPFHKWHSPKFKEPGFRRAFYCTVSLLAHAAGACFFGAAALSCGRKRRSTGVVCPKTRMAQKANPR